MGLGLILHSRLGNTVNCLFCPWGSISRQSRAPWFLLLIVKPMWGKERGLQKEQKRLCTIVTNCGINSQSFHIGLHSLRFVMCNGCLAPIFTCHCSQSNREVGWKFLFMCSKATGCWAIFFLTETITLFIENKCWHLEGAAAGESKAEREREAGPLCALESASGAIWQQWRVPGGTHLRIKHAFQ